MIDRLRQKILERGLNVYSIAEMTSDGIRSFQLQPANACNDSYSVSKVFTLTAVGMLQDDGLLDVRERVFPIFKDRFPEGYDRRWEQVTLEDVILHKVGFDAGFLDIDADDIGALHTDDFLSVVLSRRLPFLPGEKYVYSDAAYYLLSRVVTEKCGRKLDELLQERLFLPLGIYEAAWSRCPEGYPMGATGLYLRTSDMVKLGWVYLSGGVYGKKRIVSEAWVSQVLTHEYELGRVSGRNACCKGGMFGQMLYLSFDESCAVALHGYLPDGLGTLFDTD